LRDPVDFKKHKKMHCAGQKERKVKGVGKGGDDEWRNARKLGDLGSKK